MSVRDGAAMVGTILVIHLFQSCASGLSGNIQKVPVTAAPQANVTVDGIDKGTTPLTLHLKKNKEHVVRFEREGFHPLEIRMTRDSNSEAGLGVAMDVLAAGGLALLLGKTEIGSHDGLNFLAVFPLCLIVFVGADYLTGGMYELSPKTITVALSKIESGDAPRTEILNIREGVGIRWIRIRYIS